MKKRTFVKYVSEMIQNEKEEFERLIESKDWEALEAKIYEYITEEDR